ncbi:hypothetical protein ACFVAV_21760 [Nocardia sp. NPDC057663]|uniref:hypothetical protein n=1 Tax=Nocardia sp. NPDC057663 TaxID=3346201 RepID=UPI00366E5769
MTGDRRARAWVAGYCALLALIIVGPLAGSGYLLLRDAVSTPRSFLTDSALGLGAAAPRAVPQDALLAVLSAMIDGGLLVKAILIVALWSAGYGAAVLTREFLAASTPAQLVAATLALWNPFVAERLLQGHWSLLAGYAALPWTALAAVRVRQATQRHRPLAAAKTATRAGTDTRTPIGAPASAAPSDSVDRPARGDVGRAASSWSSGAWAALTAGFAAAGLTPTGSLLAAIIGLALVGRRAFLPAAVLWIATCAPWLTATVLGSGAEPSDPAGVSAFAARAEPWLGTLGSLAGLGGIWNSEAVPVTRTTPLALVGTVLLLGIVALGVRAVWRLGRDGRTLLIIAAVAIVLPALGATSVGLAVGEWLVVHIPGAGLLRDTQKYVALAMPAYALCAAAACRTVSLWWRRYAVDGSEAATDLREPTDQPKGAADAPSRSAAGASAVAVLFIALLILPLADLAWGVGGTMRPAHYPAGWAQVVDRMDAPGDVAVLPAGMFRRFQYSGTAPVLDPAPRILPNDVLQTGELRVRGYAVTGEGNRARTVEDALLRGATPAEIAALGVGWIVVERTTPGPLGDSEKTLTAAELAYQDADLALYRIPGHTPTDIATPAQRWISAAAHLLWAALLVGGLLTAALLPRISPARAARPTR